MINRNCSPHPGTGTHAGTFTGMYASQVLYFIDSRSAHFRERARVRARARVVTIHQTCSKLTTLVISILLSTNPVWADETRYWQCTTSNNDSRQWVIKNIYERAARGKATDACKKQSQNPASCKTDCEEFNHGISTRPSWQCTALDLNARRWVSQTYTLCDDAAIAAKTRCKELSSVPDSCFLNFSTCKNLNQWH